MPTSAAGSDGPPDDSKYRLLVHFQQQTSTLDLRDNISTEWLYNKAAGLIKTNTAETIALFRAFDGHKEYIQCSRERLVSEYCEKGGTTDIYVEEREEADDPELQGIHSSNLGKRQSHDDEQVVYGPVNKLLAITDGSDSENSKISYSSAWTATRSASGFVGLANQGATCYLNSLLQTLFMTPEFRDAVYRCPISPEEFESKKITKELQVLFAQLQTSNARSVSTTSVTKSFGWDHEESFQQHDIQELMRVLFERLEVEWADSDQRDKLNQLYQGHQLDFVMCKECHQKSAHKPAFMDVQLVIRAFGAPEPVGSVEEAISAYVQTETLEGDNQYMCDPCSKKTDALKGLQFSSLPYLLTLQLKRFDLDYSTFRRIKLNDRVSFPFVLDLNAFIPENPDEVMDIPAKVLAQEDEGSFSADDNAERIRAALANGPNVYELYSVMIHSGSALGGHYYAYIRSFGDNKWYNFNDSSVTEVQESMIRTTFGGASASSSSYSRTYASSANAYMLMYRRVDQNRNLGLCTKDDIPAQVMDLVQELEQKEREEEEEQRKKLSQSQISVFYGSEAKPLCKQLSVDSKETMEKVLQLAIEAWEVQDKAPAGHFRLRKYAEYRAIPTMPVDPTWTVNSAIQRGQYSRHFFLEQAQPDGSFPQIDENDMFVKVFILNPETNAFDKIHNLSWNEKTKIGEVKQIIAPLMGCEPADVRMAVRESWNVVGASEDDEKQLFSGHTSIKTLVLYVDASAQNGKTYDESQLRLAAELLHNTVAINVILLGDEKETAIEIDKRKTLRELKEEYIAPRVPGVAPGDFKLCTTGAYAREVSDLEEMIDRSTVRYSTIKVVLGRPLPPGGTQMPLSLFDEKEMKVTPLFEVVVTSNMLVSDLKAEIGRTLDELIENAETAAAASSQGEDEAAAAATSDPGTSSDRTSSNQTPSPQPTAPTPELAVLRRFKESDYVLRKLSSSGSPGQPYENDGRLPSHPTGLVAHINPQADIKQATSTSLTLFCRHWHPDTLAIDKAFEIVLDLHPSSLDLANALSIMSGIEAEHIELGITRASFPFEVPTFDVDERITFRKPSNGELKHTPDWANSGVCYYFKDSRAKLKEVTDDERKAIEAADRKRCRAVNSTSKYYRKEKALQIK